MVQSQTFTVMRSFLTIVISFIVTCNLYAQNVGIGTTTPAVDLHIQRPVGRLLIESTNPLGESGRLQFGNTSSGTQWQLRAVNNNTFRFINASDLNEYNPLTVSVNSGLTHLGIGVPVPAYALDVYSDVNIRAGNLYLRGNNNGVILDAADKPLITRSRNPFISGPFAGVGRWGLFMEPGRLIFGIPATAINTSGFDFSKYTEAGTRINLMGVTNDGRLTRPQTGNADMAPIAFGKVRADGVILGGSGNFSVTCPTSGSIPGHYIITVTAESLADEVIIVSSIQSGADTVLNAFFNNGSAQVDAIDISANLYQDSGFAFVIYRY